MGANASTANGASDGIDGRNTDDANSAGPDDFYELLGLTAEASYDEIRRGFRTEALKWHPDKNAGSEIASKRFVKIQAAYEVLSDDQERAYYDAHRGDIGRSDLGNDHDLRERARQATAAKQSVRISAKHLMRFFDATLWNNDFTDAPESFYGIYRVLFDTISQSEVYATAAPGEPSLMSPAEHYPSFGLAAATYDSPDSHLKKFYAAYLNFASRRPFNEVDLYRLQDAPDRRVKRLMEKENQRARDDARKEYNDAVRSLAAFLKKRDPRFLNSTSSDPLRLQQLQRQNLQKSLREAALKAAKDREANAKAYVEQSWQRAHRGNVAYSDESGEESEEESNEPNDANDENGESPDEAETNRPDDRFEAEDWFCPACDKDFASQGAWDNHSRSRKHQQNMKRLQKEMRAEDSDLNLSQRLREDLSMHTSAVTSQADDSDDVVVKLGSRATRKAQKRAIRTIIDNAHAENPIEADEAGVNTSPGPDKPAYIAAGSLSVDNPLAEVDSSTEEARPITNDIPLEGVPSISKKDKRRAKEAAKKAAAQVFISETCNVCNVSFISRTKLFEHINETGHARAGEKTDNAKGGKKGKRK